MGESGVGARAKRASATFVSASQSAGRAGASAARASASAASRASRALHKVTHASGAGRTGLAQLIELSAAGSAGDGFVAVALAGTLFFSTSVDQARGRVALALIITMAPFALLAPFIGPMLDRVQRGRRFILIGTVLARGLLCWGMAGAVQHNDSLTLLPAAFGVLLLQKAYGVTRASVTPRLLPSEITLVTANARCALASLVATTAGVPVAAGISAATGGGSSGAAWVLRIGTFVYLAAMVPAIRIPDGVDEPAVENGPSDTKARAGAAAATANARAGAAGADAGVAGAGAGPDAGVAGADAGVAGAGSRARTGEGAGDGAGDGAKGRKGLRARLFPQPFGPVVTEAIRANITLRAYSGFMIFFLAFLLRSVHFGSISDKLALGGMIAAVAVGGFTGTAAGAALRARAPQLMIYAMLAFSAVITTLCAVFFGLWAAVIVAFSAAAGQTLVKLALDSVVQREIHADVRSSTFAVSETLHQLSWVIGGLIGLLLSLTDSGVAGLAVAAAGLMASLGWLLVSRRKRVQQAGFREPLGVP
ncbi:MAG TPA: MFS transporter [Streptosporangiaceae bacterium]|nr:MFS transporter [Streptosporangiaceae bacterium]